MNFMFIGLAARSPGEKTTRQKRQFNIDMPVLQYSSQARTMHMIKSNIEKANTLYHFQKATK